MLLKGKMRHIKILKFEQTSTELVRGKPRVVRSMPLTGAWGKVSIARGKAKCLFDWL